MQRTDIEYLTHTWNPIIMRCDRVSEGCLHCWHLRYCDRMKDHKKFTQERRDIYHGKRPFMLDYKELDAVYPLRKPARIGVQFMGDFYHDKVDDVMRSAVMKTIRYLPRHTFLLLTKRPHRIPDGAPWWKNIWLGVSVENQAWYERRWHELCVRTRNADRPTVRWLSVEPALGPVVLAEDVLPDWVVWGPETGTGQRCCEKEWGHALLVQCRELEIPFFDKTGSLGWCREYPKANNKETP